MWPSTQQIPVERHMRCNSRTVKPNPKRDEMKYKVSPLSSCLRFFEEWGHLCSDRTQAFIITRKRTKTAKTGVNQIFSFKWLHLMNIVGLVDVVDQRINARKNSLLIFKIRKMKKFTAYREIARLFPLPPGCIRRYLLERPRVAVSFMSGNNFYV